MKKLLIPLMFVMLVACQTKPETPREIVLATKTAYAIALRTEVTYENLPRCSTVNGNPKICSKVAIIKTLQKASNAAWTAIQEANSVVKNPAFEKSAVDAAILSATALTDAFVKITDPLEIQ